MNRHHLKPKEQTTEHVAWLKKHGITHFDVGILNRETEQMNNRINISDRIDGIIRFARFQNWSEAADIFIRPHNSGRWPMIFADDVSIDIAERFASRYTCLLIHTSEEGGCQLWIPVAVSLTPAQRLEQQRGLVSLLNADPGSVSGEHYGRLSGFKNHKRAGQWCNLYAENEGELYAPGAVLPEPEPQAVIIGNDHSESGKEFGFACHALRRGETPASIISNITSRAAGRGKRDPSEYAQRTVDAAINATSQERSS